MEMDFFSEGFSIEQQRGCAEMNMFCFQCQETSEGRGCTAGGACGKSEDTANFQDLLIFVLKGIGLLSEDIIQKSGTLDRTIGLFLCKALFTTITNTNFDSDRILLLIQEGLRIKRNLIKQPLRTSIDGNPVALWDSTNVAEITRKSYQVGVLTTQDPDTRSLRELITYSLKGIGAYVYHANILGFYNDDIVGFVIKALASTTRELSLDSLLQLALDAGKTTIAAMELLDTANEKIYGTKTPYRVSLEVGPNPGILISGHDLKDMDDLLRQTARTGIDVYTHSEMIAAHYYPAFRKFPQLRANYGNAWWNQGNDFGSFNGPIIVTSNCIVPVTDSYKDRIFTTGTAAYPGVKHIYRDGHENIDLSEVVRLAQNCRPPQSIDKGDFLAGFGWKSLEHSLDSVIELISKGRIRRLIVMGGCDGRDPVRKYYTNVARMLPQDAVILTAGCAKFRFMKLLMGDIAGIPRIIEAGQCNDCYSLLKTALTLKNRLELRDINDLPISYNIAWYDQKAVAILLSLLSLGIRNIRIGPTLPAFFSQNVLAKLVGQFSLKSGTNAGEDVQSMMSGN